VTEAAADHDALNRVCDRLRSATEARLTRPDQGLGGASVAEVVHDAAVWAVERQGLPHAVPRLHPLASGDQLAVIGRDFLVWASGGPERHGDLAQWRARIDQLRAAV
jgi:hypothetical protein